MTSHKKLQSPYSRALYTSYDAPSKKGNMRWSEMMPFVSEIYSLEPAGEMLLNLTGFSIELLNQLLKTIIK